MKRYSKKREAILNKIRSTTSHPTAEWVYEQLKPEYPDLSLATVYRNIASFLESGELVSVGVVDSKERFDADTSPHVHFVCGGCGAVIDLPEHPVPCVKSFPCGEVERCEIVFHGKCDKCM